MPHIVEKHIPKVTHIGFLDRPAAERRPTIDGPGISVSTHPEDWRAIAGLNGPEMVLRFTAAKWVDALEFSDEDRAEVVAWMLAQDYARAVTGWTATRYDEEADDFIEQTFESREAAARFAGRSLEEEIAAEARGQGAVMEEETYRLTRRALKRLVRWPDPLRWFDGAVLLYCREVVLPKRPLVVGVWWGEAHDRRARSCPSGVLFPERLDLFDVVDEDGDFVPFADAAPSFAAAQA
ncbi:hypothetical protein [Defluviimonas salinarum]|uniref:Uncharacterized protein n=1 Tax=Defluviimonas salinarum TaxID=2992147 RepID=A0ABT3J497_9RHOB|nr:hypothetical protein [Defluviimonas salinarum]MCW3782507.1 hypothetical protein [Defluviimonas salinarum]